MKKILILLAAICCCGCSSTDVRESVTYDEVPLKIYVSDASKTIYTVEIEGHIYVVFSGHYKGGIIHAEHCQKKRNAKEKERLVYAANKITELGYTCKWIEQSKCLQFDFKGSTVRFFPYTGWFSGKAVNDGRGLNNLLNKIRG